MSSQVIQRIFGRNPGFLKLNDLFERSSVRQDGGTTRQTTNTNNRKFFIRLQVLHMVKAVRRNDINIPRIAFETIYPYIW